MHHYSARGYPPSDVPPSQDAYSHLKAADDAVAVLDAFGVSKAHIVGLSMAVSARCSSGSATRAVLSLLVSSAGSGSTRHRQAFLQETQDLASAFRSDGSPAVASGSRSVQRIQLRRKNGAAWGSSSDSSVRTPRWAWPDCARGPAVRPSLYDLTNDLREIKAPTLVLNGDEDEACSSPGCYSSARSRRPASSRAELRACAQLEEPALYNYVIRAFVGMTGRANGRPRSSFAVFGDRHRVQRAGLLTARGLSGPEPGRGSTPDRASRAATAFHSREPRADAAARLPDQPRCAAIVAAVLLPASAPNGKTNSLSAHDIGKVTSKVAVPRFGVPVQDLVVHPSTTTALNASISAYASNSPLFIRTTRSVGQVCGVADEQRRPTRKRSAERSWIDTEQSLRAAGPPHEQDLAQNLRAGPRSSPRQCAVLGVDVAPEAGAVHVSHTAPYWDRSGSRRPRIRVRRSRIGDPWHEPVRPVMPANAMPS